MIQGVSNSHTEVLVQDSSVGTLDLLLGLGGSSGGVVVEVSHRNTVQVDEGNVGGTIGQGNVCVVIEHALSLSSLDSIDVQASAGQNAGDGVLVSLGGIGAIVVQPGDGLQVDAVLVPVQGVSLEHDGVLSGSVGDQVGTAVCDIVGGTAVGVGLSSGIVLVAELTALGLVEGSAQRCEAVVAQHGVEVGSGLAQGVDQGVVIGSLDTDLSEVGDVAGMVLSCVDDNALNQPSQAFLAIQHVLHAIDEVVSSDVSDLTALRVGPLSTLADVEGPGQAVLGLFPGLCQSADQNILGVVLDQAVEGVDNSLGVSCHGGSQSVPGLRIVGVAHGVSIGDGVAVGLQELLSLGLPGAGALQLAPHSLQLVTVSDGDQLVSDDQVVVTIGVVAPHGAGAGVGNSAGDSVVTASGNQGNDCAGLQQLSLSDSHQSETLGDGLSLVSCLVGGVELAQDVIIDGGGQLIVVVEQVCVGVDVLNSLVAGLGNIGAGLAAAGSQRQHHDQGQNQAHDLGEFLHLEIPPS